MPEAAPAIAEFFGANSATTRTFILNTWQNLLMVSHSSIAPLLTLVESTNARKAATAWCPKGLIILIGLRNILTVVVICHRFYNFLNLHSKIAVTRGIQSPRYLVYFSNPLPPHGIFFSINRISTLNNIQYLATSCHRLRTIRVAIYDLYLSLVKPIGMEWMRWRVQCNRLITQLQY